MYTRKTQQQIRCLPCDRVLWGVHFNSQIWSLNSLNPDPIAYHDPLSSFPCVADLMSLYSLLNQLHILYAIQFKPMGISRGATWGVWRARLAFQARVLHKIRVYTGRPSCQVSFPSVPYHIH